MDGQIPVGEFDSGNTKHAWDIEALKDGHKVLKSYEYKKREVSNGYAGRTLYVDLSNLEIREKPVTEDMKRKFTGGRGFGLKLLWDTIKPTTRWDSDENGLVLTAGPLGGSTQYPGFGKSLGLTVSPSTDIICDSNAGGFFAPYMKFAGFDAVQIHGRADEDVVIFIDGVEGRVTIETAPKEEVNSHLLAEQVTHLYAVDDTEEARQRVAAVSAGKGAENSYWGCLNISFYDIRRKVARLKQHGRGGLGTVLRHKRIKAVVARAEAIDGLTNDPNDADAMAKVGIKYHREIRDLDKEQCNMRTVGTGHLVEIMDDYDLLPTENYRFGSHQKASQIYSPNFYKLWTQVIPDGCWYGCTMACAKAADGVKVITGPYKGQKVTIDGPEYETLGCSANMGIWEPKWVLEFNFYCDTYGIDTISAGTAIAFYMEMFEYGILDKERCDGLDLRFGNAEAMMEFLHRMASGYESEFMNAASKGCRRMKDWLKAKGWGDPQLVEDAGMESKGLEYSEYVTKESLAMQGGYGLTLKGPQHDEAWLIFMDMVNNQIPTFEDKAEALWYFPMWRTWFGLNGLCKLPWNDVEPADNAQSDEPAKVPEHVQNYVEMFAAVTGQKVTSHDLISMSERAYNWQRAMNVWMGRGRRADDWIPYRSMGPVTELEYNSRKDRYDKVLVEKLGISQDDVSCMPVEEKMRILYDYRQDQYQKLADAVYFRRGWTPNGVPTPQKMRAIGFGDEDEMLNMLQQKIDEDEAAGLNVWGGDYGAEERPPTDDLKYWEKW
ncbi:MAG: aldehyde:ferredoxin oxidoreductase [Candidatus Proteinoplasmatales archaeon SG8-5]|nr:MAG: aldehyde:ferredoxin oxidoreductase [Candidatus Proteinoplasmatales archaeon SG8-5]